MTRRAAARAGKPVLLDFSGYGCVNCRKMDGAVLDKDQVKTAIARDFVTIKLMVDDKKTMPQPVFVEENGRQVELDTYGDLWSYLQRSKFGANSQPYYVVLDAQGRLMSGPAVYDEDVNKFIDFLNKGLNNYKANGKPDDGGAHTAPAVPVGLGTDLREPAPQHHRGGNGTGRRPDGWRPRSH